MTSHYYKSSFHAQTPSKCPGDFQRSVDHTTNYWYVYIYACVWKCKEPRIAKIYMKNKSEGIRLLDLKTD